MSNLPTVFGNHLVVPAEWRQVLRSVQGYFSAANIAGGALRDLWHNKPIKDVDIFIPVNYDVPDDLYESIMLQLDPYAERIAASIYGQSQEGEPQPGFRHIHVIWRLEFNGVPYELIFIQNDGEDMIDVFDLSIAQIAYDGISIRTTLAFAETIATKIITVCNINRADRQAARLERVLSKYPEYRKEEVDNGNPWN